MIAVSKKPPKFLTEKWWRKTKSQLIKNPQILVGTNKKNLKVDFRSALGKKTSW